MKTIMNVFTKALFRGTGVTLESFTEWLLVVGGDKPLDFIKLVERVFTNTLALGGTSTPTPTAFRTLFGRDRCSSDLSLIVAALVSLNVIGHPLVSVKGRNRYTFRFGLAVRDTEPNAFLVLERLSDDATTIQCSFRSHECVAGGGWTTKMRMMVRGSSVFWHAPLQSTSREYTTVYEPEQMAEILASRIVVLRKPCATAHTLHGVLLILKHWDGQTPLEPDPVLQVAAIINRSQGQQPPTGVFLGVYDLLIGYVLAMGVRAQVVEDLVAIKLLAEQHVSRMKPSMRLRHESFEEQIQGEQAPRAIQRAL